ncbi:MAG: response regulator [Lachnospiraceae bacterium]|nr:response regulator [Lachnospiraceae bacterium]
MLKVMLVDDEPFIMQGLSVLIDWEDLGYKIVKCASNGGEAYDYLKENSVDLIISDISMPVMSGLELLKRIREEGLSDAYFVVLSGYNDFAYAQQAIRYTCMEYLLKPINKDQLTDILKRVYSEGRMVKREDEVHDEKNKVVLYKKELDDLIRAIDTNEMGAMNLSVDALYDKMYSVGMTEDILSMNLNYLQVQLIHLAVQQDETVDQEEVLNYISENVYDAGRTKGSRVHLKRFALGYAEYLGQLRKNASRGVLSEVEKEIKKNYADNLTLRDLSKKYYVNPAYLGQMFKKKYNQSFKDYLCQIRINEASSMLLNTDDKISLIAEKVGYKDVDYFIQKFIEQKGITPAKYRRNGGKEE